MLHFVCEHCKESVRVKEAFAGRNGRCPHCREIVTIPGRLVGSGDDNVSALAAALDGKEHDDGVAPPPPPTTAVPDIEEDIDLVDIEAAAEFETDSYPAIRPKEPPGPPRLEQRRPVPISRREPIPAARITWQNILLIIVAVTIVGAIGAMIVWTHFR